MRQRLTTPLAGGIPGHRTTRERAAVRYLVALVLALAFSALYLQASRAIGHLSQDLQPDDVGYALECAYRADVLAHDGLGAGLLSLVERPAHSYLATVQGTLAFMLLGIHDFALYCSNAWLLLAIALGLAHALRARGAATVVLAVAFALSSPMAYYAINEFRPDIALGVATALGAWALLEIGFRDRDRLWAVAGTAFGFALAAKQTFFPHTAAIAAAIVVPGLAGARWRASGRHTPFAIEPAVAWKAAALAAAIALPLFALNARHVLEYFWMNTFGAAGPVWNYGKELSTWEVIEELAPVSFMLGRYQPLAALAVAVLCSIATWRRGHRAVSMLAAGLLAVALVSAAIIVAGRQPSPFFFATADWLLAIAAIHAFVAWTDGLARGARKAAHAAGFIGVALLCAANSAVPAWPRPPGVDHGDSANEALIAVIARDRERGGHDPHTPASVLVLSAGTVNPATLMWVGRTMGHPVNAPPTVALSTFDQMRGEVRKFEYVEVPNPLANSGGGHLPIAALWVPMLEGLLADRGFEALTPLDGPRTSFLFANRGGAGPPLPR